MTNEINNFWKSYLNDNDEDIKETREFLKSAGIDVEKSKNEFLELLESAGKTISKETALERIERGKKRQIKFDKLNEGIKDIYDKTFETNNNIAMQYREEGEISEEEKKRIEEMDRKRLDILKKIEGESGEKE